ncbi:MAG: carbohydrate-binding protein, partial [Calditrichaeota bacterium]
FSFRIASATAAGRLHVELDDRSISAGITLKNTGGWQNWSTVTTSGIILEQGRHALKLYFETGDFNMNFFEVFNPSPPEEQPFKCLAASTRGDGKSLMASFNKKIAEPLPAAPGGFSVRTAFKAIAVNSYEIDASGYQLLMTLAEPVFYEDRIYISYNGNDIKAVDATPLVSFTDLRVQNRLESRQAIPGQLQAENFDANNGFQLENTTDSGGGQNLGYSDVGDYADYRVTIKNAGTYTVDYRVASESSGGRIDLLLIDESDSKKIHSVTFPVTGGWQTWRTVSQSAILPEGRYTLRLKVTQSGFNLNWLRFQFITSVEEGAEIPLCFKLTQNYPNPFNASTTIRFTLPTSCEVTCTVYNILGKTVETLVKEQYPAGQFEIKWDASHYSSGLYFYTLQAGDFRETRKTVVQK